MFNVTQEDWDEWKSMPVTAQVFKFLKAEAEAHREMAGHGGCFTQEKLDFSMVGFEYTKRMIQAGTFEDIVNITLEDILPEEDNIDEDTSSRS